MSEEETIALDPSETQLLTAEYKDGQLQIVEVTPFERDKMESILPDMMTAGGEQQKYMQVLDPSKGLVQLDLLNLTLVRCEDGEESYRLITNSESDGDIPTEGTVTCVLQSSDGEEHDNSEFVMVEGEQGPLVFLHSTSHGQEGTHEDIDMQQESNLTTSNSLLEDKNQAKTKKLTPIEILEKVKTLQKTNTSAHGTVKALMSSQSVRLGKRGRRRAGEIPSPHELLSSPNFKLCLFIQSFTSAHGTVKALMSSQSVRLGKRGRRRAGEIPSPHELLSSPNFKLYLYSCKLCSYKCNAVKDLAAHRASEHSSGSRQQRAAAGGGPGRAHFITLQCARCPYRAHTHSALMRHVQTKHCEEGQAISLDCKEVEEADVLVCGACGFESGERAVFRSHILAEHGAQAV